MWTRRAIIASFGLLSLGATDAVAQEPPAQDAAPKARTWRATAELRPRTEFFYNQRFNLAPDVVRYLRTDNLDALSLRTRLGLEMAGETLQARVQLQSATVWGLTGGDELTDPGVGAHEAYARWSPVPLWWLQAGRFEVAYGDHRVLGNVGWSQVGRSWDGIRTGFVFGDEVGLDVLGLWYQDGLLNGAPAYEGRVFEDDSLVTGAYFHSADWSEFLVALDGYALVDLQFDKVSESPQRQLLGTFGARVGVAVEPAQLVVEGAYQTGERCVPIAPGPGLEPTLECEADTVPVQAGFVDGEFAVTLGPVRPFIGFGMATGDNPDTARSEGYFHMYPTAHKFLGLMDIVGPRTNVREGRIGATLEFDRLSVKESLHHFTALQPEETAVGIEADTTLTFEIIEGLKVQAGHGVFIPFDGVSLDNSEAKGVASWWFLQLAFNGGVDL